MKRFIIILILMTGSYMYSQWANINLAGPFDVIPQSECTIGMHPANNNLLMVAFNDFTTLSESQPGFTYSTDGGQSFISLQSIPDATSLFGFDPCIQFNSNNTIFYSYISSTPENTLGRVYVSRTTNLGSSWFTTFVSNGELEDKPWMGIDNTNGNYAGRIYISWVNATGNKWKVLFSYSTDGGVTFQPERIISEISSQVDSAAFSFPTDSIQQADPATINLQSPIPFVAPNGNLYIVWMQNNGTTAYNTSEQKFIKSTNGGVSFGPVRTIANFTHEYSGDWCHLRFRHWPSFAIDGSNGNLYVVYRDRESQVSSIPRIKFVKSTNSGSNWSTPVIIGNLGEQGETFPWVATNSLGKVAVSFLHKKNSGLIDCYVIESENSGMNFGSSVLVSTEASTSCGNFIPSFDYQGMVIDNLGNDYVVWTDFRTANSNGDPFFSKVNTPPLAPSNFSGTFYTNHPKLLWSLNVELDITGYEIWRKIIPFGGTGSYTLLTTVSNTTTSFIDYDISLGGTSEGKVFYKLRAKDYLPNYSAYTGEVIYNYSGINKIFINNSPESFELLDNYPNPFNPSTTIRFSIPDKSFVTLKVYDMLGREVAELINDELETGNFEKTFEANNFSSGVYIYRITAMKEGKILFSESKQMLLVK
jgi:hypothetical protein